MKRTPERSHNSLAMNRTRSAQISLEFLIVAGFAVMLLVVMLGVASRQIASAVNEGTRTGMNDVALSVQQELLTARSVGDGYERHFSLPSDVQGRRYTISLSPDGNSSVVRVTVAQVETSVRAPRCTGTIGIGWNVIRTANGTITCARESP